MQIGVPARIQRGPEVKCYIPPQSFGDGDPDRRDILCFRERGDNQHFPATGSATRPRGSATDRHLPSAAHQQAPAPNQGARRGRTHNQNLPATGTASRPPQIATDHSHSSHPPAAARQQNLASNQGLGRQGTHNQISDDAAASSMPAWVTAYLGAHHPPTTAGHEQRPATNQHTAPPNECP